MEFWHIILLATVIGIVILGAILAILFCCNNEQDTQNPQEIYRRYDVENQNQNLKQDNRRILILKKKGSLGSKIPNYLLQKHFLEENEDINANKALELSKSRRAPSGCYLTQNTVFENPSQLWKCTVVEDTSKLAFPETEVYVSDRPLQTFQCFRKQNQANEWIVKDIGMTHAVFGINYHFIDECLKADVVWIKESSDEEEIIL